MGSFYANLVLRDVQPEEVAFYLKEHNRRALVSQLMNGCCVVFEESSESDVVEGEILARELSRALGGTALYANLYDSDVLVYWLYKQGICRDAYDSHPGYFDQPPFVAASQVAWQQEVDWQQIEDYRPPTPSGGDARALGSAFHSQAITQVERILRSVEHVFADERHQALAYTLGMPAWVVYNGYRNVANGRPDNGLDLRMLIGVVRTDNSDPGQMQFD